MKLLLGDLTIHARVPTRYDRGLLDVDSLAPDEGMLFPFDQDTHVPFHTHGMRFPIDLLFMNAQGRIVSTAESVPPGKVVTSPWPFRAVLEVPAGTYAKHRSPFVVVH